MSDHKYDILHVRIPINRVDIEQVLVGQPLIRYPESFTEPVQIGVITEVSIKELCIYAMITDTDTINELLNDNPASLGMEIVDEALPEVDKHQMEEWVDQGLFDRVNPISPKDLRTILDKKPDFTNHDGSHDYD